MVGIYFSDILEKDVQENKAYVTQEVLDQLKNENKFIINTVKREDDKLLHLDNKNCEKYAKI